MSSLLTSAYLISVGILLMAAAHAAILAHGSGHPRTNWSFAALCLGFAGFQLFNAMQYSAPDLPRALAAHRWANFFSILVVPLIAFAAASLDAKKRPLRLFAGLLGLACLAIAYNFMSPFGYRFYSLAPDQVFTFPWGESLRVLQGQPTLVYRLVRLTSLCVMVYTMNVTLSLMRMKERLSSMIIWIGLAIMGITLALGSMSDSGVIAMPYLGGFGFVFLAGAFSLLVRKEMLAHAQQEQRITRALAEAMQERHRANERADKILHQDALTGLPNRAGFCIRLENLLGLNRRLGTKLAVVLFDINHLGAIKGTHGLTTSDEVLRRVSQRLCARIRDSDVLARTRSDGFALIASHIRTDAGIGVFCEKLSSLFADPVEIDGLHFQLTASTGMAIFPNDAMTAGELLAAAELALHEAKHTGTNQLRAFDPSMKEKLQQRINLESALREAIGRQQFFLCYQPQVCATSGRTLAVEALIRWQHPEYGLVSPLDFIPLAESTGLIIQIGAWVIETACSQLAAWQQAGHGSLRMAVNLSAAQLLDPQLEDTLLGALARNGLAASDLELEITESVLIQDPEHTVDRLVALRNLGLRLSIDDFGTGYSSLSYLRVLPVQAFKLDRTFVDGMDKDTTSLEICASTIRLAESLKLDIVAEGVETEAQARQLRELGCPIFQGYFFSRPLSADAAGRYLQRPQSSPHAPIMPLGQAPTAL
ncbi:MAG: hypothetical protein H6R19_2995 [Proteobacteria bacterium]|nr:hypothetical protein [Pseudomonadota bacterium]